MDNVPTIFCFKDYNVRIKINDLGEALFNATDVCVALGYANPHQALSTHIRQNPNRPHLLKLEVGVVTGKKADGSDAIQIVSQNYVTEGGVYDLIFGSTKPEAQEFRFWVIDEVLPSIRKTGSYSLAPQTYAESLRALADAVEENERLALVNKEQAEKIALDAPKVAFTDQVVVSGKSMTINKYAKWVNDNHSIKSGERKMFTLLRLLKVLMVGRNDSEKNTPYQKYIDNNWCELKTEMTNIGEVQVTYITPLGAVKLFEMIKPHAHLFALKLEEMSSAFICT